MAYKSSNTDFRCYIRCHGSYSSISSDKSGYPIPNFRKGGYRRGQSSSKRG